jgi:hypothetical protein
MASISLAGDVFGKGQSGVVSHASKASKMLLLSNGLELRSDFSSDLFFEFFKNLIDASRVSV